MDSLPTVAIAGATGNLGGKIANALLLPQFRARFRDVIVLARSESPSAERLVSLGARLRVYSEDDVAAALRGVDVLINAVGPGGLHFKETLLRSLPATSVRLYFPSEFGVNHYVHDFAHDEWDAKKRHFRLAEQLLAPAGVRVCRVYAGLFLEDSVGPWFGFSTRRGRYEAVGSPTQRTSYTSMHDVGAALAVLASSPPGAVPAEVLLGGDSRSFSEIARVMEDNGAGRIEVSSVPLEEYRARVLARPTPTPERYLRFLMGEGKIDHTEGGLGNHNHLVEGAGGVESWKSMADLAKETRGTPWADVDWEEAA